MTLRTTILMLFLCSAIACAQTSWERMNGPYGGYVNGILAHPSDGTIFAATYPSYVYRSTNHGADWVQVKTGMSNTGTFCFTIDSAGVVYAGGYGGIFRSTDNGETWNGTTPVASWTRSMTADPSGYVYGGTTNGIVRSVDGGFTFNPSGLTGKTIHSLTCNSAGELFAGTSANGVYRSTDQGTTWTQSNSGLTGFNISAIAVLPVIDDMLLASDQLYLSTDAGINWTPIPGPPAFISGLLVQPVTRYFFAATGTGIYRSTDFGANWSVTTGGVPIASFNNLTVDAQGRLFASGQVGVCRSTDNGASWQVINNGLTNTYVTLLSRNNHDTLFAGTPGNGLYRSGDLGRTWISLAKSNIEPHVNGIGVLTPAYALSSLIMGTGRGLYRSTDNGDSWTELTNGLPPSASYTSVFSSPSGYDYVGAYAAGIYRSTDNCNSWQRLSAGLTDSTFISFAYNTHNGALMAGSQTQGVFYSADDGNTWTQRNTGIQDDLNVNILAYCPGTDVWYAGTGYDSLYHSTNSGVNWTDVSHGAFTHQVYGIETKSNGELFVGWGNGMHHSTDNGATWSDFMNGLSWPSVRSLMIGNLNPFLWAGTDGWGVYRTTHYVPLELRSFTALRAGSGIQLRWSSARETNTLSFDIERRSGEASIGGWSRIAGVRAAGSLSSGAEYGYFDDTPPSGKVLSYRLRILDNDGTTDYSPVVDVAGDAGAAAISLAQNYPNPVARSAGASTSIVFTVDAPRHLTLRLFDALGRQRALIAAGDFPAGAHSVRFETTNLTPGTYMYRLEAQGYVAVKRLVVVE